MKTIDVNIINLAAEHIFFLLSNRLNAAYAYFCTIDLLVVNLLVRCYHLFKGFGVLRLLIDAF
jgi:hypothetical protein